MISKFELDGEIYTFNGKKWMNSMHLEVPISIASKLNALLSESMDFEKMGNDELLEFAQNIKEGENYHLTIKVLEILLDRADIDLVKLVLPRLTSCYRKNNFSEKALDTGEHYLNVYGKLIKSVALYTSLAGACCDLNRFEQARRYANLAKSISMPGISQELINVYSRIKKYDDGIQVEKNLEYKKSNKNSLNKSNQSEHYQKVFEEKMVSNSDSSMENICNGEAVHNYFRESKQREALNRIWKSIPIEVRKDCYSDFELISNTLKQYINYYQKRSKDISN